MLKTFIPVGLLLGWAWLPLAAEPAPASGLELSSLDKSVEPAQDFYRYANGGWLKRNVMPPEVPEWGRIDRLSQENHQDLYEIVVKSSISHAAKGSLEQQLGDFYVSGTDTYRLDLQGIQPLQHDLTQIRAIKDLKELETVVISLHQRGIQPFFNLYSTQDDKNSQIIVGELTQAGLGLPEPEYYTRTDERSLKQLAAYQKHLQQAFHRLGYREDMAKQKAEGVFQLEKRLAVAGLTHVERRDPANTYHPTTLEEFSAGIVVWDWPQYFQGLGIGAGNLRLNLESPRYFDTLYTVLGSTEISVLRDYLEWNLLRESYSYLSEDLAKFRFDFYGKILTGSPTQGARAGRVLGTINSLMAQGLSQKYAENHFSSALKAQVGEMVELIRQSMDEDISNLSWMSPATKQEAHAKLKALRFKVGHPDKWQDYSSLEIRRDGYLENVWRTVAYENRRDWAKLGKAPDRDEWHMSSAEVNAYYDPHANEVVIPAGIIQPPFFSAKADDALNFGGLGSVISHEITHGFDDQGRKFDGQGNFRDWWTPADLEAFQKLAGRVEEQFNGYTVQGGRLHLNGKLVLGESIADLGGLRLSYMAYQKLLQKRPGHSLDGFTPEQRFFLSNAHIWAANARADYERLQVNVGTHPPGRFRVNGPASNMPEFARAFQCPAGSPMVRAEPILIW